MKAYGRATRTAPTQKQAMRKSCLPAGIESAAFESLPANVKNITIDL